MLARCKDLLNRFFEIVDQDRYFPLVLLVLSLISFGILLPSIGLYSDDWHLFWLSYGSDNVARFFFHNRPYLGSVYQIIKSIIPASPLAWQCALFLLKWSSAILFWLFLRAVFSENKTLVRWMSLLFVFYPGNLILFQPIVFMIAVLQLNFLFFSFFLNIQTLKGKKWKGLLTFIALCASAFNLIASEYFFFLELIRPFFLWLVLRKSIHESRVRIKQTILTWLPYLAVFVAVLAWRVFFQADMTSQTPLLLQNLLQQPLAALAGLLSEILNNFYHLFIVAWDNPKLFGTVFSSQISMIPVYFIFLVLLSGTFFFLFFRKHRTNDKKGGKNENEISTTIIGIGLVALLLGGLPAWLAGYKMNIIFSTENRFVLPFLLGVCLVSGGLIFYILRNQPLRVLVLSAALAMGVGSQFLIANLYRQEWDRLGTFYWQMLWRIPDLQTGIHFITNEPPFEMEGENSISAGLNWIYAKNAYKKEIDYYVYFNPQRIQSELGELVKDMPIHISHQIGDFSGSNLQLLTYYYAPPGCLHVLDPQQLQSNPNIPAFVTDATRLSDLNLILPDSSNRVVENINQLFGQEPSHDWCYFYEKADLARQFKRWSEITLLYQQIKDNHLQPADEAEWMPFIEGLAHEKQLGLAMDLSHSILSVLPENRSTLCGVWRGIVTSGQLISQDFLQVQLFINNDLKCGG